MSCTRAGVATLVIALATIGAPRRAAACCGFYVAGSDQPMFNDATQVVLMRMGTRTVLSVQNNYQGPPDAFAMVIPVPVVLHEGDVKTLAKDVFARVERMGAPRLVEYWEQDPCRVIEEQPTRPMMAMRAEAPAGVQLARGLGVTVEAKFAVGEYQVLILSAKDSTGLETWLVQQKYRIPAGAEPLLRPYVEAGSKFFVAKVDPAKVAFDSDGRAALSPLRFHYDSEELALPIRLGLASSSGIQDLIVNILAPHQRYEVSNYPNVTIPTNIDVGEVVKDKFPAFYAALFDRTLEKNPGAVVTEYAWQASSCDPCPGPALGQADFVALGADVLVGPRDKPVLYPGSDLVLTRLHARYDKTITDDLRFREAAPIVGGRELVQNGQGGLEEGARAAPQNNFQGRYAIRHPWTDPIRCEHPQRGVWGGPPDGIAEHVQPAVGIARAPRGQIELARVVRRNVPELGIVAGKVAEAAPPGSAAARGAAKPPAAGSAAPAAPVVSGAPGCGCATTGPSDALAGAALVAAGWIAGRRRRQIRRG